MTEIGHARVSTDDQQHGLAAQVSTLEQSGCEFVFKDIASGRPSSRPQWDAAGSVLKKGDVLVAVRLDRFSRPVKDLLAGAEDFRDRSIEHGRTDSSGRGQGPGRLGDDTAIGRDRRRSAPIVTEPVWARPSFR